MRRKSHWQFNELEREIKSPLKADKFEKAMRLTHNL